MVHELAQTFFISQRNDAFAICNIILPNADQHDRKPHPPISHYVTSLLECPYFRDFLVLVASFVHLFCLLGAPNCKYMYIPLHYTMPLLVLEHEYVYCCVLSLRARLSGPVGSGFRLRCWSSSPCGVYAQCSPSVSPSSQWIKVSHL